jgi:two-component system cell cycle response regulator
MDTRRNKKILIVDDNPDIIRLLNLKINGMGYSTLVAYDGYSCIKIAKNEQPDLILLDIKMPFQDGVRTFKELLNSEETTSIPVIFMTAYPRANLKQVTIQMGANEFLSKPFGPNEVENAINRILDY